MTVVHGHAARFSLALCVLVLVAAACGGEQKAEPEGNAAAPRAPDPTPRTGPADPATPEETAALRQVQAAVADLQRQCAPQPGTPRAEVERIYGAGRPTDGPMIFRDAPADTSAWWIYQLELPAADAGASTARLNVVYDEDWKVGRSYFDNPHGSWNEMFCSSEPSRHVMERHLRESRRMIEHMERVHAALEQGSRE